MTDERFTQYVEEGITALPEWVRGELKNVAFLIEDEPSDRQRAENELLEGEVLFGLYEGVPLSERGTSRRFFPTSLPYSRDRYSRHILMRTISESASTTLYGMKSHTTSVTMKNG
jgi:predicted Zn-dependent protease with MMP-like domain